MNVFDMRLNYKKSTHVIVNNHPIAVQYCFTKDDVAGVPPGNRNVWVMISFQHPQKKELVRLRVMEPQSVLDAAHAQVQKFIEHEVECYINHCDEDDEFSRKTRMAETGA